MMPFFLVLIGLILILFEFYLPGAVMGILGGISILAGIILFASHTSSLTAIILFVLGSAVAVGLLIRFALWRIVHAKPQYSIYLDKDQEGYQASSYDKSTIGKTGIVIADLKPGGFILIEGRQHPAISLSGYIAKWEQVTVVGGQEQSLMVKRSVRTS
jgi:membrane-bound ClpP family serine protease